MESREIGSKKRIKYDYSIEDIHNFFEEQNLKLAIPYITHKKDGEEISGESILLRMKDIIKPDFSEDRRNELAETKQYIKNSISRYSKGESYAEKMDKICSDSLPNYIKDNIDKLNKEKIIYQKTIHAGVANNFYGMYTAFKNIFNEYRYTELTEKEIIKKILKVFYNAERKFKEELGKAEIDYKEELERRANENDANDMYKKYSTLNEPKDTARNETYEVFFKLIDPIGKFKEQNKKIFDIICTEFDILKSQDIKKQTEQRNGLKEEKNNIQKEQTQQKDELFKKLNNEEGKQIENLASKSKGKESNNQENDERAKHANGQTYHREGETPYD